MELPKSAKRARTVSKLKSLNASKHYDAVCAFLSPGCVRGGKSLLQEPPKEISVFLFVPLLHVLISLPCMVISEVSLRFFEQGLRHLSRLIIVRCTLKRNKLPLPCIECFFCLLKTSTIASCLRFSLFLCSPANSGITNNDGACNMDIFHAFLFFHKSETSRTSKY